jgi:hypothetical protein
MAVADLIYMSDGKETVNQIASYIKTHSPRYIKMCREIQQESKKQKANRYKIKEYLGSNA